MEVERALLVLLRYVSWAYPESDAFSTYHDVPFF